MMMIIIIDTTDTSVQQIRTINSIKITTDIKKLTIDNRVYLLYFGSVTSLHTRKSESKTTSAETAKLYFLISLYKFQRKAKNSI